MTQEIIITQANTQLSTEIRRGIDVAIEAWLHAKGKRSGSLKTSRAYVDTISAFRAALRDGEYDLDSDPRAVSLAAQGWAGQSLRGDREVSASTFNQRLAILSSFYGYARKQGL